MPRFDLSRSLRTIVAATLAAIAIFTTSGAARAACVDQLQVVGPTTLVNIFPFQCVRVTGQNIVGDINIQAAIPPIDDDAIVVETSTITGNFFVTGAITATDGRYAILLRNDTILNGNFASTGVVFGGVRNDGQIQSGSGGVSLEGTIDGGFWNTGTIGGTGFSLISASSSSSIIGGFHNSGTITDALYTVLLDNNISGGIENTGQILAAGRGFIIGIGSATVSGGIQNSGTISGGFSGISMDRVQFSGGIVNGATGVIQGTGPDLDGFNVTGLEINGGVFTGGILNAGSILGEEFGFRFGDLYDLGDAGVFSEGITNAATGVISGGVTGIQLGGTFSGGINNSGSISSAATGIALSGTFAGGIANTSTGAISGDNGSGINIDALATFEGGITNDGSISGGIAAILNLSTNFSGGVQNTGSITGGFWGLVNNGTLEDGITNSGAIFGSNAGILSGGSISGGITNSGSIISNAFGIRTGNAAATLTGGIVNTSTGAISGTINAISLEGITTGGITNAGQITSTNTAINLTGTFSGGINNSGNISGAASGVALSGAFSDGILNSGIISGATAIDMTGDFDGGLTNTASGSITGTLGGIYMAADWDGRLINDGAIQASDANGTGIRLTNWLRGGLENTGLIQGGLYGIRNDGFLDNGILNSGDIVGGTYGISSTLGVFTGGITNEAGGLIEGTTFLGITVGQDFSGGIHNAGEIRGATYGIFVNDLFAGGINNTGVISGAGDTAIVLANTAVFQGGITSTNLISGGSGIEVGGILNGGINNAGQILASANNGILILGLGTLNDGVQNSGTINAAISGMLISGELSGGIQNGGTIDGNTNGIHLQTSLVGGLQNTGSIFGSGGAGLSIDATGIFEDGVTNSGLMTGGLGAILSTGTFSGGILNTASGSLAGGFWGVVLGGTFDGGITNAGSISGSNAGILSFGTFSGDIVNSGNISGVFGVRTTQAFNGGIVNTGSITSNLNAAISLEAGATGGIVNSGTISGPTAIHITGALGGDIENSGIVQGAIDVSLASTSFTYRQTGDDALTGAPSATFSLSDTAITTLDFRGGELYGLIDAGTDFNDIFEVNAGLNGRFDYVTGVASNLASFAVNSGTAYLGDTQISTNAMSVGAAATLYMSNDAVINTVNATFAPTSTFEADLSTNTAAHPTINVDGTANLAGAFIAHIDPQAFLGSGETEWVYDGIIAGNVTGTFNSVTIFGAPNFFTITPAYNSFDVTISLNSFADLIEPTNPNQVSVGDALDDIYADGTTDPDLLNLINTLANATDDEIAQILDDIAGSMQAETGMAALKSDDPWKQSVGQRVNAARSTGCTVAGDTWCLRRYAQAPSPVVTDATDDAEAFGWLETGLRDIGATSMWGRIVGVWGQTDGGAASPGSQQRTYGLVGGVDHVVDQTLLLGLAGQYVNTQADFENSFNQSSIEAVQIGPYFSYGGAEAYVNGNASIIASRSLTDRIFAIGNQIYTASVRFPSTTYTASLEGGTIFEVDGYRLEPNIGINYALQVTDTYAEGGAGGLGLIVNPQDLNSLRSLVGGRISRVYDVGDRKMVPELRLEWRHEFLDRRHTFEAAFAGAPDVTFLVNCSPSARDVLALGGSITIPVSGRVTGFIDAEGAASDDTMAGTLSLGARATW